MFSPRENIVSAFEIGTSKTCVLIGRFDPEEEDSLEVIGFGEAPSSGHVVKGEIVNMEGEFVQLSRAIEDADRVSGGRLTDSLFSTILVTGAGIESHSCTGVVSIHNPNHCVTETDRIEADNNARNMPLGADRTIINSSESYFVIDNAMQVRNPVGLTAHKLESHSLVISGVENRLKSFQEVVRDSGMENRLESIFSGAAVSCALLSEDERENGVLLVDFGAGTTEYVVEFRSGMQGAGMLQVGFEHVLNDLSLGLGLPMLQVRRMAASGELENFFNEKRPFMDVRSDLGKSRRIPLTSFETIVDARLNELFTLIANDLRRKSLLSSLGAGAVITGGGALFSRSISAMRDVFDVPVRMGRPGNVNGAVTGLADPRYSAVWGALNVAEYYTRDLLGRGESNGLRGLFNGVDGALFKAKSVFRNLRESFKV